VRVCAFGILGDALWVDRTPVEDDVKDMLVEEFEYVIARFVSSVMANFASVVVEVGDIQDPRFLQCRELDAQLDLRFAFIGLDDYSRFRVASHCCLNRLQSLSA